MDETLSNTFQARAAPRSPDTQQLVEDFIARMEAIQAEQTEALLIIAAERAMRPAELPQTSRAGKYLRHMFSPTFGRRFLRRRPDRQPSQPPAPEENTTVIIDAPYRVIDGKE
jgi:hypothetical protein